MAKGTRYAHVLDRRRKWKAAEDGHQVRSQEGSKQEYYGIHEVQQHAFI